MSFSVSTCDLSHIFLPLLASFRSACHARRFQPRCSYAVLYIHYKIASQHWGTAIPNYDLFSRQGCRGENIVSWRGSHIPTFVQRSLWKHSLCCLRHEGHIQNKKHFELRTLIRHLPMFLKSANCFLMFWISLLIPCSLGSWFIG